LVPVETTQSLETLLLQSLLRVGEGVQTQLLPVETGVLVGVRDQLQLLGWATPRVPLPHKEMMEITAQHNLLLLEVVEEHRLQVKLAPRLNLVMVALEAHHRLVVHR
jgi:hypothetical protein